MIKRMNIFVRIITFGWPTAITLAPFGIYIKEKHHNAISCICNDKIRAHEMIHWRQQMEMLILPFYLWYFIEWIIKLFKYGKQSYYNISFEREARTLTNTNYYGWIKYL